MGATHNLKRGPLESGRLQLRCNQASPRVVSPEWHGGSRGREHPGVGVGRRVLLAPLPHHIAGGGGERHFPRRALALGPIEMPTVEAMNDVYMVFRHMLPLQSQDFPRPHAREQSEPHHELFPSIEELEDLLHVLRRESAS
jgi:hypothetical protein